MEPCGTSPGTAVGDHTPLRAVLYGWGRALHGPGEVAPLMDALELDVDALYDDAAEPSDA